MWFKSNASGVSFMYAIGQWIGCVNDCWVKRLAGADAKGHIDVKLK